ncbi:MAG: hypothetical protein KAV18_05160 [Candidatus Omnitrophica bacterium]|nr:hypothetical protein [Candidatus Omnitrophota bacterium]MCK4423442.1 hypothetical protein [Candidatus Omnitrophota bacterium]
MYCLSPGIYSRYTEEELKNLLNDLDLVIIDLDECIFPGITKVRLYRNICLSLLGSKQLKGYILLGRLFRGAFVIILMKLVKILCPKATNRQLIYYFAKITGTVPDSYLQKAAELIPDKSYPGAKQTLEILSANSKLGIISQGLDIVLKEYVKQFSNSQRSFIDFWNGNILSDLLDRQNIAKPGSNFIFGSNDKKTITTRRIEQFRPKKILVIGHDADDLGMIEAAREYESIVIGFNPSAKIKKICDIIVTAKDWTGLRQFFFSKLIIKRGDNRI